MNDHLDALGRGLAEAGMSVAPRYEEQPALLRVVRPALPGVGESVCVAEGPDGQAWFRCSSGILFAPCSDVRAAVVEVCTRLSCPLPGGS